jgi:hypothetical protein
MGWFKGGSPLQPMVARVNHHRSRLSALELYIKEYLFKNLGYGVFCAGFARTKHPAFPVTAQAVPARRAICAEAVSLLAVEIASLRSQ